MCLGMQEYYRRCILGGRRYLMRESDDTIPAAKEKLKRLLMINKIAKGLFFALLAYILYKTVYVPYFAWKKTLAVRFSINDQANRYFILRNPDRHTTVKVWIDTCVSAQIFLQLAYNRGPPSACSPHNSPHSLCCVAWTREAVTERVATETLTLTERFIVTFWRASYTSYTQIDSPHLVVGISFCIRSFLVICICCLGVVFFVVKVMEEWQYCLKRCAIYHSNVKSDLIFFVFFSPFFLLLLWIIKVVFSILF